jgi:tRNA 2-selenouridine synthase
LSHKPTTVEDLGRFDAVIDVRSPAEYALDHIPGAVNCPVLSDDERRIVGTTYVQVSPFEARRLGAAMVARNIARHLDTLLHDKPRDWKPLLYCWRGGLRSGSFVTWLRMIGWDAQQLHGGYKAFRGHVMRQIESITPGLELRVLCGPTGSAKTRVLQALARRGEQVLDLEALAAHRGSVLGAVPGVAQPSQKAFETQLAGVLAGFQPGRPVWAEAESRRIGRIHLPEPVLAALRAGAVMEIAATRQARLAYLLQDYGWLGDDRGALVDKLGALRELQPRDTLARWQHWAREGDLVPLFDELMALHYDPLYARSQGRNFEQLPGARRVATDDLSEAGIETLAARIIQAAPADGAP